jgi:hypothetical protein
LNPIPAWQRLGAFVQAGDSLSEETVDDFVSIGGDYIHLLVQQLPPATSNEVVQRNHDQFDFFAAKWKSWGIERVGTWWVGWGGDPASDARTIAEFVKEHGGPVSLDLEDAYTGARAGLMPQLTAKVRALLPDAAIAVTNTGQFNNAMIWNGRDPSGGPNVGSFHKLGIRWQPEWYSSYYQHDGWLDPCTCMSQLRTREAGDGNYADMAAPGHRGLPLAFCKGVLEVTGLEGSSLYSELSRIGAAWQQGLIVSPGLSLYLLESMPPGDVTLLRPYRGRFYL